MSHVTASGVDPVQRLVELRTTVDLAELDCTVDDLLGELRFRLNVIERAPSLTVAELHRECVCRVVLLLDRAITLGGQLPHAWRHRGGRA